MDGYITTVGNFIIQSSEEIITSLKSIYPMAEESQVNSWRTLVDDVKGSNLLHSIPQDCVIAIEYSLPTDGMAADLILAGRDTSGERFVIIIESKQWNDSFIHAHDFSAYRENDRELHPQVQVSNHKLSFQQYLDIGQNYTAIPFVFIRNCSCNALSYLKSKCPRENCRDIEIRNDINEIIDGFLQLVVSGDECIADELRNAEYSPSIEIIDAMKSIVTKEDPFILTAEQRSVVEQIEKSVLDGKRIISVFGAAGTGKTAILLNLYIRFLEEEETGNIKPIFISGAQNTALYRSLYPEVERSFTYSYSLKRMVENTKGNLYVILMDEAQHNSPGIITDMVERGCTIILCYDENQTINADNPIEEIHRLEQREDFVSFEAVRSGTMKNMISWFVILLMNFRRKSSVQSGSIRRRLLLWQGCYLRMHQIIRIKANRSQNSLQNGVIKVNANGFPMFTEKTILEKTTVRYGSAHGGFQD